MKTSAFEVASRYVYPALRKRLVEILRKKGLRQAEIAELLHITQPAVSRYLREERGALVEVSSFSDVEERLCSLADEIVEERPDEYWIHTRLVEITLYGLGRGYFCQFHALIDPKVDPNECRVCLELFGR
ncbi:transcriptional regulator [Thermococcus sp.]